MSLTLTIKKLHFPNNSPIAAPITVDLYISQFYSGVFALIEANVLVNVDGTINASPLPTTTVDPTLKYIIRAVNKECDFTYDQNLIINPYCPLGYQLSMDGTYCFFEIITSATPPTSPENSVAVNHNDYSAWGSLIYNPGFNVNGTGPFTQISYANSFWVNGAGYPTGAGANTVLGPLNRAGLWSSSTLDNQTIGFSVCITIAEAGTFYVGTGADNYSTIKLDGNVVVQMDPTAIGAYLSAHGYLGVGVESTFRFWHIYPVVIPAGTHVLEVIGNNVSLVASLGVEIYNNTSAELQAATDYSGLNLVFSSKDFIGQPIVLGNSGIGYSCPDGYALKLCDSPIDCIKIVTTPLLY